MDPSGKPPFKFVEPIGKKAEKENLQGATCQACQKIYDAVLEGDAKSTAEFRCNHVDNSRHQFCYVPLETLEGFWNIGFDTEV